MAQYASYSGYGGSGGGGSGVTAINGAVGPSVTITGGTGISVGTLGNTITVTNTQSAFTPGNLTDAGTDGITITGGTNAVNGAGTSISQHVADSTHNGYLSSTDWSTFNNKQPAGSYALADLSNLTSPTAINQHLLPSLSNTFNLGSTSAFYNHLFVNDLRDSSNVTIIDVSHKLFNLAGNIVLDFSATDLDVNTRKITNLVDPTNPQDAATRAFVLANAGTGTVTAVTASAPLSSTGGTTPDISISQAGVATDGYLSSTDWNTFNGKQASGSYITALTGDGTATGPGSVAFSLATVNGNVGSFGSSTAIPSFTVNGKGLITAASTNAVIAPAGTLTGTTLASNVVTSSLTSVGTITTGVWNGTAINETHGGTNQTSYATGDILYASAANTLSKRAIGSNGDYLTITAGVPAWTSVTPGSPVAPTIQRFTSSSGTYTTPTSPAPLYIKVTLMGGGGGGAGSGSAAGTAAGAGGDTTFGSSFLTAGGGGAGTFNANPPAGGTNTINAGGTTLLSVDGASGAGGSGLVGGTSGIGGASAFGGAGGGGYGSNSGFAAAVNSGSGGGGGGTATQGADGLGGGSGGYIVSMITSPSATYSYGVGAAGTAGGAGTLGFAGGAGGSGVVLVEEFYQ